ncbi:McbB family protein [Paenibacillus profundus]|uniref:McbB family protein n=1 Tax=Paenibacillus profundus TaxID=1173085 RepID=A0ABS8YAT3_9BACL|nr:McbB family protein [Paenibacillus profundus]MCE5168299.1 McbB family protein [Paenibacillus profundus]
MLDKEIRYKINNFIIHEIEVETTVVIHTKGIVKIKEERLGGLIKKWDLSNQKSITEAEIKSVFKEDFEAALSFMIDNYIIEKEIKVNYSINKLVFLSNNQCMSQFFDFCVNEEITLPKKNQLIIDRINDSSIIENDCLYVVFLNPYNKKLASQIRDCIKSRKNSLLLMTYVYNNSFYMDSLYFPTLYNPCHLCHIGHIESQLRVNTNGGITYQQIIDSIYLEESNFSIHTPLTKNNILNIATMLSNKLSKFIFLEKGLLIYPEELHECHMIELETNNVYSDYALHWELCDCYE